MADCYSTAGTDAALTAALLAYYTSAQVDALLGDYRTGAAQDAETSSAITAALLAYYTSAQVDALLVARRTRRRRPPSRERCWPTGQARTRTCSQPTKSPRRWRRTVQPLTRTRQRPEHRSRAAQLLHHRTSRRPPCGKLGVTEAALALQIAVRFPDDGGADEVVAAIEEQILGPRTSRCQTGRFVPAAAAAWSWPRTLRE